MMPLHQPTVAKVDALPSGQRARLMAIVAQYPADTLAAVQDALTKNGVPEEFQVEMAAELLDSGSPGGFGPEPVLNFGTDPGAEGPDPSTLPPPPVGASLAGALPPAPARMGLEPAPTAAAAPLPPEEEYVEPELSTGGTIVDVLGKLMGGIAVGMSPGARPGSASQYIRQIQQDQEARRKSRRDEFYEGREQKRDDIKFSWEQKSQATAEARKDPKSTESRVVQRAAEIKMTTVSGQPLPAAKKAELAAMPADQVEAYLVTWGEKFTTDYARTRDLIGDQQKQQAIESRYAQTSAQQEANRLQSQGMMDIRRGQLDEQRQRREDKEAETAAKIYDMTGQDLPGFRGGVRASGAPAGELPPAAAVSPPPGLVAPAPHPREEAPGDLMAPSPLPPAAQRAVQTSKATERAKFEEEERQKIPGREADVASLTKLKGLLETSDTISGPLIGLLDAFAPSFVEAALTDRAKALQYVKDIVVARAKTFGAAPTEGERKAMAESILSSFVPERDNLESVVRDIDFQVKAIARSKGERSETEDDLERQRYLDLKQKWRR